MQQRRLLVDVMHETADVLRAGSYGVPYPMLDGSSRPVATVVRLPADMRQQWARGLVANGALGSIDVPLHAEPLQPPEVWACDTVAAAEALVAQGLKVTLLNMANEQRPGGDLWHGSAAQEEDLHRRSDLLGHLEEQVRVGRLAFPIPDGGAIFSPRVTFFRDGCAQGFALRSQIFRCDVVSAAAFDLSRSIRAPAPAGAALGVPLVSQASGLFTETGTEKMKEKIRTVLRLGRCRTMAGNGLEADFDSDAVVLGAWGCGAFHNPPAEVARCFKEVLAEDGIVSLYRRVVFAVIEDRTDNLAVFRRVLVPVTTAEREAGESTASADVKLLMQWRDKAEYTESICDAMRAAGFAAADWLPVLTQMSDQTLGELIAAVDAEAVMEPEPEPEPKPECVTNTALALAEANVEQAALEAELTKTMSQIAELEQRAATVYSTGFEEGVPPEESVPEFDTSLLQRTFTSDAKDVQARLQVVAQQVAYLEMDVASANHVLVTMQGALADQEQVQHLLMQDLPSPVSLAEGGKRSPRKQEKHLRKQLDAAAKAADQWRARIPAATQALDEARDELMLARSRKVLLSDQLTLFIHTPKLVSRRTVGALVVAELGYGHYTVRMDVWQSMTLPLIRAYQRLAWSMMMTCVDLPFEEDALADRIGSCLTSGHAEEEAEDQQYFTFSEEGSLGILFQADVERGAVNIAQIRDGSAADLAGHVEVGMVLLSVQGTSVKGLAFDDMLAMLMPRPVTLGFLSNGPEDPGPPDTETPPAVEPQVRIGPRMRSAKRSPDQMARDEAHWNKLTTQSVSQWGTFCPPKHIQIQCLIVRQKRPLGLHSYTIYAQGASLNESQTDGSQTMYTSETDPDTAMLNQVLVANKLMRVKQGSEYLVRSLNAVEDEGQFEALMKAKAENMVALRQVGRLNSESPWIKWTSGSSGHFFYRKYMGDETDFVNGHPDAVRSLLLPPEGVACVVNVENAHQFVSCSPETFEKTYHDLVDAQQPEDTVTTSATAEPEPEPEPPEPEPEPEPAPEPTQQQDDTELEVIFPAHDAGELGLVVETTNLGIKVVVARPGGLASEYDDFLVGLTLRRIDSRDVREMRFEDVVRELSKGRSPDFPSRADRPGVPGSSVPTLSLTFVGQPACAEDSGSVQGTPQPLPRFGSVSPHDRPEASAAVQSVPFAEWNDYSYDDDELTASVTSNVSSTHTIVVTTDFEASSLIDQACVFSSMEPCSKCSFMKETAFDLHVQSRRRMAVSCTIQTFSVQRVPVLCVCLSRNPPETADPACCAQGLPTGQLSGEATLAVPLTTTLSHWRAYSHDGTTRLGGIVSTLVVVVSTQDVHHNLLIQDVSEKTACARSDTPVSKELSAV